MALRAFAISAVAVSKARSTVLATEVLTEKVNEVYEKCISENGLGLSSFSQDVSYGLRKFSFTQNVSVWQGQAAEDREAEGVEAESEDILVEEIEAEGAPSCLAEVNMNVGWKSHDKSRGVTLKTLLPYSGFRNDF